MRIMICVAMMVVGLVVPEVARAALTERMLYPTSMCTYWGDGDSAEYGGITYFSYYDVISFSGSASTFVICPIPRESTSSGGSSATIFQDVEVDYRDNSSTGDVECEVKVSDNDHDNEFGEILDSNGRDSNVTAYLDFSTVSGTFGLFHQAVLVCEIPAIESGVQSSIIDYIVDYPG